MKSFRKYFLTVTALVVAAGIVYETAGLNVQQDEFSGQACGFFDSVFEQRERNRQSVEQARAEVDQIKKQLIANNNKFVVGITDAMRRRIEDLVGTKKPQNLQIQAGRRFSAAEAEMNNFMREMQRSGFKMPDFFYGWNQVPVQPQPVQPQPVQPQPSGPVNPNNQGGGQADNKPNGPVSPTPDSNVVPPDPARPRETPYAGVTPNPALQAFNWRDAGMMTPIRDQKSCGSCWAFTTMGVLEGANRITNNVAVDLSEQYLVDCSGAGTCNGGWYGDAFDFMKVNGALTETDRPYKARNGSCVSRPASTYRVVSWAYVKPDASTPSVPEMKAALCKYGPLAVAMKAGSRAFAAYKGGIYDERLNLSGRDDVDHGVVLVGWDDTKRAYLIRNSWNTTWGEEGYAWVQYDTANIGFGAAWVVVVKQ